MDFTGKDGVGQTRKSEEEQEADTNSVFHDPTPFDGQLG